MSERQGLTRMCEHFYPYVLVYARQFTTDVEDLTQDVMVKACRAWSPAMETWSMGQMANWLKKVTRTTAYDMTKRAQVREPYSNELPEDVPTNGFEQGVEDRETIQEAWARLGERPRLALSYCAAELTYKAMMQREHVDVSTMYHRIRYAREMFRRELEAA